MNKRKLILIGGTMLLASFPVLAQRGKITNTYNYYRHGDVVNAKREIDQATSHEVTKELAKTWYYKGKVYQDIFLSEFDSIKKLDDDPLSVATRAYLQVYESAEFKKVDKFDLDLQVKEMARQAHNAGADAYDRQKFNEALKYFQLSEMTNNHFGKIDTAELFISGATLIKLERYPEATTYLSRCLKLGHDVPAVYDALGESYLQQSKPDSALSVWSYGVQRHPESSRLYTQQANWYLEQHDYKSALQVLDQMLEKLSEHTSARLQRALIHSELGQAEKAISDYLEVLKRDNSSYQANYNLGAMYYNLGVEQLDNNQDAAELKFKQAMPYLEAADRFQPDDVQTLNTLKYIYSMLKMEDKLNRVVKALEN